VYPERSRAYEPPPYLTTQVPPSSGDDPPFWVRLNTTCPMVFPPFTVYLNVCKPDHPHPHWFFCPRWFAPPPSPKGKPSDHPIMSPFAPHSWQLHGPAVPPLLSTFALLFEVKGFGSPTPRRLSNFVFFFQPLFVLPLWFSPPVLHVTDQPGETYFSAGDHPFPPA